MEKKWMISAVAAVMTLSLVGCSSGRTDAQSMMDGANATRTSTSTYRTSTSTGSDMMKDAHYYASNDGQLPTCDDATQKGCEMRREGQRAMTDVERAMHDVGKTMGQVIHSDSTQRSAL